MFVFLEITYYFKPPPMLLSLSMLFDYGNLENSLPRHTLAWTAPWLFLTIMFCLELSTSVEKCLMTLATLGMILFYYSEYSLGLFFCFEAAGLPLLLSILLLGRQPQKLEASKFMLFYIAMPSIPLLVVILSGFFTVSKLFNATSIFVLLPFSAKMPCYLLHAWLPKAHVEASTIGSMVLAGSVMKMGSYGALNYRPSGFLMSSAGPLMLVGVGYVGATMLRGIDIKTLVAYSSVLHMAVGMMAWASGTYRGYAGMIFSNVAHTLLSPMMFLSVSAFYNSRSCRDRNGLRSWQRASLGSVLVVFLFLLNGGMPPWLLSGTELLMIVGCGYKSFMSAGVAVGIFLSGLWTLLLGADQGRRDAFSPQLSSIYPINSGLALTSASPLLVL